MTSFDRSCRREPANRSRGELGSKLRFPSKDLGRVLICAIESRGAQQSHEGHRMDALDGPGAMTRREDERAEMSKSWASAAGGREAEARLLKWSGDRIPQGSCQAGPPLGRFNYFFSRGHPCVTSRCQSAYANDRLRLTLCSGQIYPVLVPAY